MATDIDNKKCRKWNDCEVFFLISIWKNFTLEFNDYTRNSPIYHRICAEFSKCYAGRSVQDIRKKISNLMLEYRQEKVKKRTGYSANWRFYSAVDEVVENMPKREGSVLLNMADGPKSSHQQELPLSLVMQDMELDDTKKLKNSSEETTHLLKNLVISHNEHTKTTKEIDAKLLEIVTNLKHLQEASFDIGGRVHQQLKMIVQNFEKTEMRKSDSLINAREEPNVSKSSQSISLLDLHDKNLVTQISGDCGVKLDLGETDTKNSITESSVPETNMCESSKNILENPLPSQVNKLDFDCSSSKNVREKPKPQANAEGELQKIDSDSLPGMSVLKSMAGHSICNCSSTEYLFDNRAAGDNSFQNPKKHLEWETSEYDDGDDDIYFLKSMLSDLRRLPQAKKAFVKLKIQEIIFNQLYGSA